MGAVTLASASFFSASVREALRAAIVARMFWTVSREERTAASATSYRACCSSSCCFARTPCSANFFVRSSRSLASSNVASAWRTWLVVASSTEAFASARPKRASSCWSAACCWCTASSSSRVSSSAITCPVRTPSPRSTNNFSTVPSTKLLTVTSSLGSSVPTASTDRCSSRHPTLAVSTTRAGGGLAASACPVFFGLVPEHDGTNARTKSKNKITMIYSFEIPDKKMETNVRTTSSRS